MFNFLKNKSANTSIPETIKPLCPYCSFAFDKMPTRKAKCKSCGKEFSVRTHYLNKNKIILTDKEAILYDIEKDKYYTDKSLIDGLKMYIDESNDEIDNLVEKTRIELTAKFGKPASLGDVGWGVANRLVVEAIKKNNMGFLRSIYFQMGLYLHNTGKDSSAVMENSFNIDLNEYKKSDVVKKVEVIATTESCDYCKALNGKIFSISEALEKKILPCKQCIYKLNKNAKTGWCRCCYAPFLE